MKLTRTITTVTFCLCLMSVGFGGRNIEQNGRVTVLASAYFNAENVKVTYINLVPHLQYTLTNRSGDVVSGLEVTFTAYDAKGNMCGHQKWITRDTLPIGSRVGSTFAMNLDLNSAKNMSVEFAPTSFAQVPACDPGPFCTACAKEARESCGQRGVQSLTCTVGETCTCAFTCAHL
jgi:hypothetical protein